VRVGPPTERKRRSLDRFEALMVVLGGVFLALSVGSVVALITLISSIGDLDPEFPGSTHVLTVIRSVGIAFFAVMAVVTFGVANWLVGGRLWSWVRGRFRRR
jgi:fumarate reductase subunit D